MLEIDYDLFITNLHNTQAYCQLQMNTWETDDTIIDIASVFRSFNPEINGKKLFEFSLKDFKGTINPVQKLVRVPTWTTSPYHLNMINNLLRDQLAYKEILLADTSTQTVYAGNVVAVQIDASLAESDSAPASYYLFDDDDIPAIDTWFYCSPGEEGYRVLFAWIPDKYREYIDYAIVFNDLGCIDLFEKMFPDEYRLFYEKFSQVTSKNAL
jgi:hypothetical protein